jgi:DNA-binding NtrC family response regulator
MLEPHLHIEPEFNRNLPVVVHKTTDQAERELIYRALMELRMSVEEIHSILLGRGSSPKFKPDNPLSFQTEVTADNILKNDEDIPLKNLEKIHIKKILDRCNGNRRKAAKALGIGERTLYRKLKEYGLDDIK